MTTERTPPRTAALELRLYVVAILAAAYLVAWRAIATPAANNEELAGPVTAVAPVAVVPPPAQRTVWLDDLPAGERPHVAIPAGWHVVAHTNAVLPPTAAPVPRTQLVRVPASTPRRVRTRSS